MCRVVEGFARKNLFSFAVVVDASLHSSMTSSLLFLRFLVATRDRHDNAGVFTYLSLPRPSSRSCHFDNRRNLFSFAVIADASLHSSMTCSLLFLRFLVAILCLNHKSPPAGAKGNDRFAIRLNLHRTHI